MASVLLMAHWLPLEFSIVIIAIDTDWIVICLGTVHLWERDVAL